MTTDELKKFVGATLDERLIQFLGSFEIAETADLETDLTWDEIRALAKRYGH